MNKALYPVNSIPFKIVLFSHIYFCHTSVLFQRALINEITHLLIKHSYYRFVKAATTSMCQI